MILFKSDPRDHSETIASTASSHNHAKEPDTSTPVATQRTCTTIDYQLASRLHIHIAEGQHFELIDYKNGCPFYGSARGCKYGSQCRKKHENVERVPLCRWHQSKSCKFGDQCKYRHFQTEDELFRQQLREWSDTQRDILKSNRWTDISQIDSEHCKFFQIGSESTGPSEDRSIPESVSEMISLEILQWINANKKSYQHRWTGKIWIFVGNSNSLKFQIKKRIYSSWDDDVDVVMEGLLIWNSDETHCGLQIITQQIYIHKRREIEGDSYGSMIVPNTSVWNTDYVVRGYWLHDLSEGIENLGSDVMVEILEFAGYPIFEDVSVLFVIMDCFAFQVDLDLDEDIKGLIQGPQDIPDSVLRQAFRRDSFGNVVGSRFEWIKRVMKAAGMLN